MKDLPAREKFDLAAMVSQYLVIASTLDKASAPEDYDQANELSLELAMLLPAPIYRAMVQAAAQPDGKVNQATVATMVRKALFASDDAADLQPEHIAIHMPGAAVVRPKTKAH
jgi:hypothetical protein